jgi:CheY-like chemotaxis protein
MPGMSGREVAQRLREISPPADLTLVAVTRLAPGAAPAEHEDFSHYLLKPAELEHVVHQLNSI